MKKQKTGGKPKRLPPLSLKSGQTAQSKDTLSTYAEAAERHKTMTRDVATFHLPNGNPELEGNYWRKNFGFLPFPVITIVMDYTQKDGLVKVHETSNFNTLIDDRLMITSKFEYTLGANTMTVYSTSVELEPMDGTYQSFVNVDAFVPDDAMEELKQTCFADSLYSLHLLFHRLESNEYSSVITQNLATRIGHTEGETVPTYQIVVRQKYDRAVKSNREIFGASFAEQRAHYVRAHMRREHTRKYKSGKVAIVGECKVRDFVRGKSGTPTHKDYEIK